MSFSWAGWARVAAQQHRVRGLGSWPGSGLKLGLGVLHEALWHLESDARPPEQSLVIVGHQRSGTTWLHRMLASHGDAFALPLHAMLWPHSGVQRLLPARPAWFDRAQDRVLGPMDRLHRLRFHEPEEDEFALWAVCRSDMNRLGHPWGKDLPPALRDHRAMTYYAQVVARAARRTGRRYVGKNPHFSDRVPELRESLPGVFVVGLWRDPWDAVRSRLALIEAIWRQRVPGFEALAPHHIAGIVDHSLQLYRGLDGHADLVIRYEDLVADPIDTVRRIHAAAGLPSPSKAWKTQLLATQRVGRAPHRPSDYGLDPYEIRARAGTCSAPRPAEAGAP